MRDLMMFLKEAWPQISSTAAPRICSRPLPWAWQKASLGGGGLDDVSGGGRAPDVLDGRRQDLFPAFAVGLAEGVIGGLVAVVGSDQGKVFARGVDDGFVAFPHFLRGPAPGDFVAEVAVGGGKFGGPLFQRLVEHLQPGIGLMEPTMLCLKRQEGLGEESLNGMV